MEEEQQEPKEAVNHAKFIVEFEGMIPLIDVLRKALEDAGHKPSKIEPVN